MPGGSTDFVRRMLAVLLAGCLLLAVCGAAAAGEPDSLNQTATAGEEEEEDLDYLEEDEVKEPAVQVADPLAFWNRAMFYFNDKLYFWALKPFCQGYNYVLPEAVRIGIRNFFVNTAAPVRLTNCLLQGRIFAAEAEWSRFLLNSTVGMLGFGNPADQYPDLPLHPEDLGQSLGTYGLGHGLYIVWPVYGPSSLRDSLGDVGDGFLHPRGYLDSLMLSAGLWTFEKVNDTSLRIGDYETLKEAALDPYQAVRDAYVQFRMKRVAE